MVPQIGDDRRPQQPVVKVTPATERPKQTFRSREIAEQRLGPGDLALGERRVGLAPERQRMAEGVVADPVSLGLRALGNGSARRLLFELALESVVRIPLDT